MYMKKIRFFSLFLVLLTFISCNSRIDGSLFANGSAVFSLSVSLEPRMATMIRSLSAARGQADGPVLNGPAIAQSMSHAPGIASVSLRNTSPSAVEGQIQISQISDFLAVARETSLQDAGGREFIVFEQGTRGHFSINLNRGNGPVIIELLSPEISDYLNALMAPITTGEDLSKIEYLELVASFYNRAISDEIAGSRINASIQFPGVITGVRGGTFSGRTARFDISLLDLLVLETPLVYEVNWN